jgi:hypothetical protein
LREPHPSERGSRAGCAVRQHLGSDDYFDAAARADHGCAHSGIGHHVVADYHRSADNHDHPAAPV